MIRDAVLMERKREESRGHTSWAENWVFPLKFARRCSRLRLSMVTILSMGYESGKTDQE